MISKELELTNSLDSIIRPIQEIDQNGEILKTIFDVHFQNDAPDKLLNNLTEHLSSVYKINARILIEYLINKDVNVDDRDELLKVINSLKYKYGFILNQKNARDKKPFLLTTVEANIDQNSSSHMLKFVRNDGESLEALFEPGSILSVISVLNMATSMAIQRGIYSLNGEGITNYMNTTEELKNILNDLTSRIESKNQNN
mgnify:CR=1 FL=1